MELDKDFKEFVGLLNDNHVKYLVVGGYSVAHHGFPRFTGDFDIWVEPTQENGNKIVAALKMFGFKSIDIKPEDFIKPDKIIQLGNEPLRIDILTSIDGLEDFSVAYEKRDSGIYTDLKINFINIDDLIINKKTSNRIQDQRDIEELEKIRTSNNKDKKM